MKLKRSTMQRWLYILLGYVYLTPMIVNVDPKLSMLNTVTVVIRTLGGFAVILLYFVRKKHITKSNLLFFMFGIWMILADVTSSSLYTVFRTTRDFICAFSIICLVKDIYEKGYYAKKTFLFSLTIYVFVISILNLITQIIAGDTGLYYDYEIGWQKYYICGNPNSFVFSFLTFICIVECYEILCKRCLGCLSVWIHVILLCSAWIGESSNCKSIICLSALANILFLTKAKWIIQKHYKKLIGVFIVVAIWFVIGRGWESTFVRNIVQSITKESLSYLDRGTIWGNSAAMILSSPIVGYGSSQNSLVRNLTGGTVSAHNNLLQIGLYGGIPGVAFYVLYIISIFSKRENKYNGQFNIGIIIFLFIIAFLFEQNPWYLGFYFVLALYDQSKRYAWNLSYR